MTSDDQARPVTDGDEEQSELSNADAVRKDMTYSPASETETQQKQDDPLPSALDDDIDTDAINVAPGTGGPDDVGDVEVDPADLNLPGRSEN
ncbi:hypothetical protein QNO21_07660 [Microbacterium sp. zg-Y818]|uniref:hypothetical protein n=1 Tax=unclassified Microbacterium TaxID=2609290 RepID=UPI00214AACB1|nr:MULTISPECIES: hypothetical protein [unclassified Microbacterium]MCR2801180.1 hypothetical protein [Microbacterium sp. zg.Y818]WIM21016.1 hypothetical protein QNO21_07660 [Microbacterium sp. zg-Y818]